MSDASQAGDYRLLHTMIRVKDLDKALAFYEGQLGMKVLSKTDSCLSGSHSHPLGLEWAQAGYRGARHGCSRPR